MKKLFFVLLFSVSLFLGGCKLTTNSYNNMNNKQKQISIKKNNENYIIQTGSRVWVDYILRLENGKVFDTSIKEIAEKYGIYNPSRAYTPLEFVVGAHQVIPGFEKAVIGHKVGDKITVKIPPEEAYGKCNPNLVRWINKSVFDEAGIVPQVGKSYNFGALGKVLAISGDKVKVDFNSPLCGKTLIFDIFIRKVE